MIVQPYAFKGGDFDEVYAQAREFMSCLRVDGVSVTLPDGFRSVTKYYPDWQQTMTVIEVFPDISVDEQIPMIERIYKTVKSGREPVAEETADEGLKLGKGHRLELFQDADGWLLVDCHEDHRQVVFRDVQSGVLDSVRHYLQREPGDDFDPFLDADDMP